MDQTIQFILGSHHHIPYGAGNDAFEAVYHRTLKPFISTLYKYPKIQATLHYSGVLLHWLEQAHPELFMLIGDLIARKQIELLGGGFYEPLMPLLPLSDKIGQIELLTTYLRKQFGKRPQGCILPVMSWEPNMVWTLSTCGMEYTFLDERYFRLAGVSEPLIPPCITEDQGKMITVFPILRELEATFAQKRASLVLENLITNISLMSPCFEPVICVFPEHIFAENGVSEAPEFTFHQFFEDLSVFESSIEFTNPGKVFKNLQKLKRVYFPCSLEPEEGLEVPPGSLPRQFLVRYPEANGIYAKMLFTHVLINQLRGDKSRKRSAREELWKAQGYDSFYPTKNGGISQHSIRKAAYQALLEAEKITRETGVFNPSLIHFDFDLDGEGEYLFQDNQINCYITLEGASIFELDYLPTAWNYLDTLGAGTRRTAFSDILVWPELTFQDVLDGYLSGTPIGRRYCGSERFEPIKIDKEHAVVSFRLPPKSGVPYGDMELEKRYHLKEDTLQVSYVICNQGNLEETFKFIPSIDLSFPGEGGSFLRILECTGDTPGVFAPETVFVTDTPRLTLEDIKNEAVIELSADQPFDAWIMPIRTPWGMTELYQSTCIMPAKPLSLGPKERFEIVFSLRIKHV
jgi:hypothetical protein